MSAGETAKDEELITKHMPLVRSIAKKVEQQAPQNIDFDELVASGYEGLVQAAKRYDPTRGIAFSTYAYYRIRGSMYDLIRKMGFLVGAPHRLRFQEKADAYLEAKSGEPAPIDAVSAAERLTAAVSDLAVAYVMTSSQLQEEPDSSMPDPAQVTEAREEFALIKKNLARLPEKQRALLELMYFEGETMQEAANRLGMTKGWASRLHARSLARLRQGNLAPPRSPPAVRV